MKVVFSEDFQQRLLHYVGEYGDMTSEYILHYQRFDDRIILLDITAHSPFVLPIICEP